MYEVELVVNTATVDIDVGSVATMELTAQGGNTLPYYEGEYNVTPTSSLQELATANKSMSDNVVVYATPYQEVQNPKGGYTATIL